jgi:hypothetical protein
LGTGFIKPSKVIITTLDYIEGIKVALGVNFMLGLALFF